MRPLILSAHGYTLAFSIAVALWYIPDRIGSFWWRSSRDPTARKQDHGSFFVLVGAILLGAAIGFGLAIVCILLGAALRWWAILTLGRYFTFDVAVRPTQAVVQSGPYRLIRHPSYSGLLLSLLGLGLALANWASLVTLPACALIGMLYRVRVEERTLTEALGQPYVDYMRRTKRFIPFLF